MTNKPTEAQPSFSFFSLGCNSQTTIDCLCAKKYSKRQDQSPEVKRRGVLFITNDNLVLKDKVKILTVGESFL